MIEIIGGILLLSDYTLFYGCLIMTNVHLYIFIFGIGPYRWNVIYIYMLWNIYTNINTLKEQHYSENNLFLTIYVMIFGLIIPCIGYFNPYILGKYFGGFRMASFHFTGNETQIGFFIHKRLIQECDKTEPENVITRFLNKELILKENESKRFDNHLEFIFHCDGFNVFETKKHECLKDDNYLFVSLFKLSINI